MGSKSKNKANSSKRDHKKQSSSFEPSVPSTKPFRSSDMLTESDRVMDTEEEMDHFRIKRESLNVPRAPKTQEQSHATDEAFMSYTYAEKAASQIQQNFRQKKLKRQEEAEKGLVDDSEKTDVETSVEEEEASTEMMQRYTVVFMGLMAIIQFIRTFATCCSGNGAGDAQEGVRDVLVEGGAEGIDTFGSMAVQAASSAGDGVGSGVTTLAMPVGGPVGGPIGGGGGGGPEVVAAQVAVAAGMAAAVATGVVASGAVIAPLNATVPFANQCGLPNPVVRQGQFSLTFKGFDRELDARESLVVENLIMEAYNEITIGDSLEIDGVCADPLAREMQSLYLVDQVIYPLDEIVPFSSLESIFNATLTCDRCSAFQPMFSLEQDDEVVEEEPLKEEEVVEEDVDDLENLPVTNTSAVRLRRHRRLGNQRVERSRQLQDFAFESVEFFQRFIQLIIFKMEELSKNGELPGGFIEINKASVFSNLGESSEVLKMGISYENKNGNGLFTFTFVDAETGEELSTTVLVDPTDLNPLETTAPSSSPSQETSSSTIVPEAPTGTPSLILSAAPNSSPTPADNTSEVPPEDATEAPSTSTSEAPSISASISMAPTIDISGQPTKLPENFSGQPTLMPSFLPSNAPSSVPTDAPSLKPSRSPSDTPSANPTGEPSESPSRLPTEEPSIRPSLSMVPSRTPSEMPSVSRAPSASPSKIPTTAPSVRPSRSASPSLRPSVQASQLPTVSTPEPSVSKIPTTSPTRIASSSPTTPMPSPAPTTPPPTPSPTTAPPTPSPTTPRPSFNPSAAPVTPAPTASPSVSMRPSLQPVARVHPNKGP